MVPSDIADFLTAQIIQDIFGKSGRLILLHSPKCPPIRLGTQPAEKCFLIGSEHKAPLNLVYAYFITFAPRMQAAERSFCVW